MLLVFTLPDTHKTTLRLPREWPNKKSNDPKKQTWQGSTRLPSNSVEPCGFSPFAVFFHCQEQKHKGLSYWFMFHVLDTKCIFWAGCFYREGYFMIKHLQEESRPPKQQSCQCQGGKQTKTGLNSGGRRSADQGNPLSLFELQELVGLSREDEWSVV